MPSRRRLLRTAVTGGLLAVAGCTGDGGGAGGDPATETPAATSSATPTGERTATEATTVTDSLALSTTAFDDGSIPGQYTCDGEDVSPPLSVSGVPDDAATLALVVDDPDAPGGTFTHWLVWNVPAETTDLPSGLPQSETLPDLGGARQGRNDFDEVGYRGPCPPTGDGPHSYHFRLFAVGTTLDVDAGAEASTLSGALERATLARTELVAEYDR